MVFRDDFNPLLFLYLLHMLYGSKCNLKLALPFHLKQMRISWLLMLASLCFFTTCTKHISCKVFPKRWCEVWICFWSPHTAFLLCFWAIFSLWFKTQFNRNASHQSHRNEQLSNYCEKYFTEACLFQIDISILMEMYPVEFHFQKILPFLHKISYSFV